jgi:energy-coupling factor transporter ATP-binding protein EcfA2
MVAARLTQIRLRNFKSIGADEQTIDLRPLTVLIGRNNSGKSTLIQSLLLLKQTLEDPRPEVALALQGTYLRAASLRELTHGWPDDVSQDGPEITLRWVSRPLGKNVLRRMELDRRDSWGDPRINWLREPALWKALRDGLAVETQLKLGFAELGAALSVERIELDSSLSGWSSSGSMRVIKGVDDSRALQWVDGAASIPVELDWSTSGSIPTSRSRTCESSASSASCSERRR